jgi:hypothetical protein
VHCYLHLSNGSGTGTGSADSDGSGARFVDAVAKDGRSFRPAVFRQAVDLLREHALVLVSIHPRRLSPYHYSASLYPQFGFVSLG